MSQLAMSSYTKIFLSQSSKIDPVSSWASKVSQQFTADDTLSILKLSFGGDEKVVQNDVENAKSFHDLFNIVLNKLYQGNKENALSRMVYLLDQVSGHRKYGARSVRLLEKFKIPKPPPHNEEEQPQLVQLYHCLAKIASRLSLDHEESIRNVMAKNLGGIEPKSQQMKSICGLFSFMVHNKRITVDDQEELVELLFNVRAKSNLIFVKKYRERNKLPLYPKLINAGLFMNAAI